MLNQHAQSRHLDILLYGFSGNTQWGNAHRLQSAVPKKLPRFRKKHKRYQSSLTIAGAVAFIEKEDSLDGSVQSDIAGLGVSLVASSVLWIVSSLQTVCCIKHEPNQCK